MSQVKIEVEADTKKAKNNISQLTREVEKLERQADKASKKQINLNGRLSTKNITPSNNPSVNTPKTGGAMNGLGNMANNAVWRAGGQLPMGDMLAQFSKFGGAMAGMTTAVVGAGVAIKKMYDSMQSFVEKGAESARQFEEINTRLSTLDKNLGGFGQTSALTEYVQGLSANGTSEIDKLSEVAQKLLVSFGGNQAKVKEWLPIVDDIGVGTHMGADTIGEIVAQLANGGKVDMRDITKLNSKAIPVFAELGKVLGTTAEEAQKMAKDGKVSTEQMMEAIKSLRNTYYKNMSGDVSSSTLDGTKATREAMESLAKQASALVSNDEMMKRNNQMAGEWEANKNNLIYKAEMEKIGDVAGRASVGLDRFSQQMSDIGDNIGEWTADIITALTGGGKRGDRLNAKIRGWNSDSKLKGNVSVEELSRQTSSELSGWLLNEEKKKDMLTATIAQGGEDYWSLSKETRDKMHEALANATKAVEVLKEANEIAYQREQQQRDEARRQEAKDKSRREYVAKHGTNQEMAQNAGFEGYYQMTERQKELEDLLKGEGLDDDQLEELQKIKSVLEAIDKRDAEDKRKEQELRKLSADIVDDRTKYSWEVSDKLDDVAEYADKTGGNVGQLQEKLLDKLEKDIVDNYKKSGGRGTQLTPHGTIYDYYSQNQYTASGMSTEFTDYQQYLRQVGGFVKHIDSAYQLAQGKDITDVEKMTQVQKQMDLMSCQIKKTNEQLQVLKDIRDKKTPNLVPMAQ